MATSRSVLSGSPAAGAHAAGKRQPSACVLALASALTDGARQGELRVLSRFPQDAQDQHQRAGPALARRVVLKAIA